MKPRCQQKKEAYIFDYPEAAEIADQQNRIFWTHEEIDVNKDLHDMKTNFTESEYHGVVTTLKLFTLYEVIAGAEYWGGRFKRMFPRPEFQRMASCFSHFELNVHAPFYNKLNEVLGLNTEDFYTNYVDDEILKARMEFIDSVVSDKDDLVSLGAFSMVEGAILYSSFAFLKHFQAEGKNKLVNTTAGINFSVRDESLHSEAGAWVFNLLKNEKKLSEKEEQDLEQKMIQVAETLREHEHHIVGKIFEKGKMEGITDTQMKNFVDSRIDYCLSTLGYSKIYKPSYNPIAKWFYKNINGGQFHDFFVRTGNEYKRDYDERRFIW